MRGNPSHRTVGLLLLCAVLVACARPTAVPSPPEPTVPISVAARDRLLDEVRALVATDACEPAARLLTRQESQHVGITATSASPAVQETHYELAQCFERQGRLPSALAVYEALARTPDVARADDVRERITALRHSPLLLRSGVTGLLLQASSLPASHDLDAALRRLAAAGINLLVVEMSGGRSAKAAGKGLHASTSGVYFHTTLAPVVHDVIPDLLPLAHRYGLRVFGVLCVDDMPWLQPDLGWRDARYDPSRRLLVPSPVLDVFNPGFREYLHGLVTDLARTGLDGIVLRFAAQPMDGFSRYATEAFQREFQLALEPTRLFHDSTGSLMAPRNGQTGSSAPAYWRWVGWKARERMKLVDALVLTARRHAAGVHFALELHAEAVTNPMKALVQYAEDLLGIRQSRMEFVLVHAEADRTALVAAQGRELLGGDGRLWIVRKEKGRPFQMPPRAAQVRATIPTDVGILLDER